MHHNTKHPVATKKSHPNIEINIRSNNKFNKCIFCLFLCTLGIVEHYSSKFEAVAVVGVTQSNHILKTRAFFSVIDNS